MVQANLWGILAIAAVAMCWALAVLLFRVSTPGSVARKLSLLLVIEGLTLGSSNAPLFILPSIPEFRAAYPLFTTITNPLHLFGDGAMLVLYPTFLAAALRTPMTRVFATRQGRAGLLVFAASLYFYILLSSDWRYGITLLFVALVVTFVYAFVASTHAWHTSTGAARTRALIFVLAFGFRDLCWGYNYGFATWEMWWSTNPNAGNEADLGYICYILGTLVAVPLIAYGILRTQLFDIDLKIRWAIRQSTVASVFIAVMFIVSEGASQFLSDELGKVTGLLAAGVLMFFLAPLQRFAERVTSNAMPNTKNTPEYAAFRKMQVYESALTEAQHEGGISDRERALLNRLRDSLGISEADAKAIEVELHTRLGNLQFAAPNA